MVISLSSADNLCNSLDPNVGTDMDTLKVFLKESFEKVNFEKLSADDNKSMENYPAYKVLR